jgi:YD repeat-containing protein
VLISPAGIGAVTLIDRSTNLPYNPTRWKLTTQDGTQYILNDVTGLESIIDVNGNTLTYDELGIAHSDGRRVTIVRDGFDRIGSVKDFEGDETKYAYDSYGDLVSVTDGEGNVTRYTYDSDHNLVEVYDPLGRRGARTEYDADGRMTRIVDADGNSNAIDHATSDRVERVADAAGNVSTLIYDERGNTIKQIDPLGHVLERRFDDHDNLLEETIMLEDGTPLTTSYSYDDSNRVLTRTNPEGETVAFTYDARGAVLTTADDLGNTLTHTYDAKGNRKTLTEPEGATTTYTQNAFGQMLTSRDELGNVITLGYDLNGNNTSAVDVAGRAWTTSYDRNGKETSSGYLWVNPNDPTDTREVRSQAFFDSLGRATRTVTPYGTETRTEYDAAGNAVKDVDELGNETVRLFDGRNNVLETRYADGSIERFVYDRLGHLTYSTDRYLPADGLPLGTRTLYDRAGRAIGTERLADLRIDVTTWRPGVNESRFISAGAVIGSNAALTTRSPSTNTTRQAATRR